MYPILIDWNGFVLPAWHTFYVLAAIGTFYLAQYLMRRHHLSVSQRDLSFLYVVGYFAGYFGARLLSIIIDEPDVQGVWQTVLALGRFGPMTFYGGFIGAVVSSIMILHVRKISFSDAFDMGLPAGLLGLAIGRIGCFLNGDDYGLPVVGIDEHIPWWAVSFPNLADGIYRYPVQLISTLVVGMMVLTFVKYFAIIREKVGVGFVGVLSVLFYSIFRIVIEFYRGDERGWILENMVTPSQFISGIGIFICSAFLFRRFSDSPIQN